MSALLTIALMAVPGTAIAHHDVPPGDGLLEVPFTLTCEGFGALSSTVTPSEFDTSKSGGPGWFEEMGMVVPRSLTVFEGDGNVVFAITYGAKTAAALETVICTGIAVTPDGIGQAIFEFVLLP